MGLLTLFGFSALGIIVTWLFHDYPWYYMFTYGKPLWLQIVYGVFLGVLAGGNLLWMIGTPLLEEPRNFFRNLIIDSNLKLVDLVFLSFAAGVGEEIFFRGTLQPWMGVWLTAILFVALHGYLNPFNLQMLMYGGLMLMVSALLGYYFDYHGLYAAMTAHFLIDLILFLRFKYWKTTPSETG